MDNMPHRQQKDRRVNDPDYHHNFGAPRAREVMAKILELIDSGVVTSAEIGKHIAMSKGSYGRYLAYMNKNQMIHIARWSPGNRRGGYCAIYATGPKGGAQEGDEPFFGRDDYDQEVRRIVKEWPPGETPRCEFEALLFAPAPAAPASDEILVRERRKTPRFAWPTPQTRSEASA